MSIGDSMRASRMAMRINSLSLVGMGRVSPRAALACDGCEVWRPGLYTTLLR